MLLSVELVEKGMEANPKNNLSMGNKAREMQSIINKRRHEFTNLMCLLNIINCAVAELNKKGYKLYKEDMFTIF